MKVVPPPGSPGGRSERATEVAMRKLFIIVPLVALAVAVWFAIYSWRAIEGPPIPTVGYVAMWLGVAFSIVVGCGLMALVFYSSRAATTPHLAMTCRMSRGRAGSAHKGPISLLTCVCHRGMISPVGPLLPWDIPCACLRPFSLASSCLRWSGANRPPRKPSSAISRSDAPSPNSPRIIPRPARNMQSLPRRRQAA